MKTETRVVESGLDESALRELVEPALDRWKVPGAEVVVVRGDDVLFAGGFGQASVEGGRPVTESTLFHHGSTGKAFTALLVAILVDDGLLEWDRPVREYVPDFRLHDSVLTERVTIRDLLAHRSGLPRHELMWVANPSWDRAELVRRLRHLEPNRDLRTEFQYWNQGYAAAGHVIGAVTDSRWEEQLRVRILEPLGMTSATSSVAAAKESGHLATPYELRDDRVTEVGYRVIEASAPAGQLIYCAIDSARWLRFQANDGDLDGTHLVSTDTFKQTRTVQIPIALPGIVAEEPEWGPSWLGYGLGWVVATYRDRPMLWHSGGIDGFRTDILVLTEDRIGILVSSNLGGSGLPFALGFDLADRLLGHQPRPWLDRLYEQAEKERESAKTQAEPKVVPDTTPSHPLDDYVGDYEHPGYGILRVAKRSDTDLALELGELELTATHRHFDTWTASYVPFDTPFPVTFVTNADGVVAEAVAELEPMVAPIRFARRAV